MSRMVKIFDTTLRDGEQSPGCSMNLAEKLEVAQKLEDLKVDIIEAGFAIASPGDAAAITEISKIVKNSTVCSLARAVEKDIDAAYEAVKNAVSPRIHTFIATSPVHMQYKLRMTPEEVLERTAYMVKYARNYVSDIEFSAEDACRTDLDFLVKVLAVAIENGATTLNIPDTVGYITPREMYDRIKYIMDNTVGIEKAVISTHCHDDLGMAVANSLAAVEAGAGQIECTINGIGERAGNTSLEEVVMAMNTRRPFYGVDCRVDTTGIYRASRLVETITGVKVPPNKAIVGANAFAHESGIHQHGMMAERTTYEIMTPESVGIPKTSMVLGKHSGRHAFEERLETLGYKLSSEELNAAFEKFKILADKKKTIKDGDLEGIVGAHADKQINGRFELVNFVINSGNNMTATAVVKLKSEDEVIEKVATGDGPINAAFTAIEKAVKRDFVLEDYSLDALTDGEDAQAEAVVKIKYNGYDTITGRGISTDIIEASIKAFLNGINKYFEEHE